ncbi:Transposon Ty3-I Gag-Pol polyprotein [Orchesella cincta]|uniref:RNA-directed DNA polymerase n=1 Tax=Orchesella cincta TaxID=48709 RepID=A0A1D2MBM3_ORCCI|nr:Transposon Ty3-I Gag-Pol polyprotein [Orchesella cincta]
MTQGITIILIEGDQTIIEEVTLTEEVGLPGVEVGNRHRKREPQPRVPSKTIIDYKNKTITYTQPMKAKYPIFLNEEEAYVALKKLVEEEVDIDCNHIEQENSVHEKLKVSSPITLPPRQYTWVPASISNSQHRIFHFQPSYRLLDRRNLIAPDIAIPLGVNNLQVPFLNCSHSEVHLTEGSTLGCLSEIEVVYNVDKKMNSSKTGSATKAQREMTEEEVKTLIINPQLNLVQKQELINLIKQYPDCFSFSNLDIGKYSGKYPNNEKIHIDTGDSKPIFVRPYRVSFKEREIIQTEIKKLEEAGIVQRAVGSAWGSPVISVQRKGEPDRPRLCVSYVKLNTVVADDNFPLPDVRDVFTLMRDSVLFTKLDFASGFHQFELDDCCQAKTTFVFQGDSYQYLRLPFGLKTAPSIFTRMIKFVFNDLINADYCYLYVDDVVIYSKNLTEHLRKLTAFFNKLRETNLTLRIQKCEFAMHEIKLLGYIISQKGIRVDPSKVEAINRMPRPTTVKMVRSFLGMASFYRRWVKDFSSIAQPLHNLTKKDQPFNWDERCENSFNFLKMKLQTAPILASFDPLRQCEIHTDSSLYAIGYCLMQRDDSNRPRVICYGSRLLNAAERGYATTEREFLSVVEAIKKLREYIYGQKIKLYCDHQSIKSILQTPVPKNGRICRWIALIRETDIEFCYNRGKDHTVADCLSRLVDVPEEHMKEGTTSIDDMDRDRTHFNFNLDSFNLRADIISSYLKDDLIAQHYHQLLKHPYQEENGYVLRNGLMYHIAPFSKIERLVIPKHYIPTILINYHDAAWAGHMGIEKTKARINSRFFWKTMNEDIETHIKSCLKCAQRKPFNQAPAGKSQPLEVGKPFERLYLDIAGPWPSSTSAQYQYVIVVVDGATRFVIADAVRSATAQSLVKFIVNSIVYVMGTPLTIVMDNSSINRSLMTQETLKALGVTPQYTSAYSHTGNSVCERYIRQINETLSHYVQANTKDWYKHLSSVVFAINTSIHTGMKVSPFYLVYGREPTFPADVNFPLDIALDADYLQKAQEARVMAGLHLLRGQDRNATFRDKTRRDVHYNEGDWVMLKYPNLAETGASHKLSPKFAGPFKVLKQVHPLAYIVINLDNNKARPIQTHVERMRPYTKRHLKRLVPVTGDDIDQEYDEDRNFKPRSDTVVDGEQPPNKHTRSGRLLHSTEAPTYRLIRYFQKCNKMERNSTNLEAIKCSLLRDIMQKLYYTSHRIDLMLINSKGQLPLQFEQATRFRNRTTRQAILGALAVMGGMKLWDYFSGEPDTETVYKNLVSNIHHLDSGLLQQAVVIKELDRKYTNRMNDVINTFNRMLSIEVNNTQQHYEELETGTLRMMIQENHITQELLRLGDVINYITILNECRQQKIPLMAVPPILLKRELAKLQIQLQLQDHELVMAPKDISSLYHYQLSSCRALALPFQKNGNVCRLKHTHTTLVMSNNDPYIIEGGQPHRCDFDSETCHFNPYDLDPTESALCVLSLVRGQSIGKTITDCPLVCKEHKDNNVIITEKWKRKTVPGFECTYRRGGDDDDDYEPYLPQRKKNMRKNNSSAPPADPLL